MAEFAQVSTETSTHESFMVHIDYSFFSEDSV